MKQTFKTLSFVSSFAFQTNLSELHPIGFAGFRFYSVAAQMEFKENGGSALYWHYREERESSEKCLLHYGAPQAVLDSIAGVCRNAGSLGCEEILQELEKELRASWDAQVIED